MIDHSKTSDYKMPQFHKLVIELSWKAIISSDVFVVGYLRSHKS